MRYARRNQSDARMPRPTGESCFYDTAIGFSDGLASGSSEEVDVEPQFTQYHFAEAAVITPVQAADPTNNGRVVIKSVKTNACDLESFSVAAANTTGGRVAPDEFQSGDGQCYLGKPVCWGWFGKVSMGVQLQLLLLNISTFATDTYISVAGKGASTLPAGASTGRRCAV